MNRNPELVQEIKGHKNTILSAKFSPDGRNLIAAGVENVIYFHKLNQSSYHYKIFAHDDIIYSLDYGEHRNVHFFLSASRDQTVKLWRINLNNEIINQEFEPIIYRCHNNTIRFVNICPLDQTIFCTASDDKTVKLWSTNVPNKRLNTFSNHTNWVRCCKFSRTNLNLLASCGDDSTLRLFDLRINGLKGSILKTITTARNRHFTYLDWFPLSEHFVAISSSNNMIRVFDLRNLAKIVQFYKPFNDSVNCLEFHPNGHYLLASSSDSTSKLINVVEGRLIYTLKGHFKSVFNCTFNYDGSRFLTSGKDRSLKLWKTNLDAYLDFDLANLSIDTHSDAYSDAYQDVNRRMSATTNCAMNAQVNKNVKNIKNNNFDKLIDKNAADYRTVDKRTSKQPSNQRFKQSLTNLDSLDEETMTNETSINPPVDCAHCKRHSSNNFNKLHHRQYNHSTDYVPLHLNSSIEETHLIDLESKLINQHNHCATTKHRHSVEQSFDNEIKSKSIRNDLLTGSELDGIFNQLDLIEYSLSRLERRLFNLETKLENR